MVIAGVIVMMALALTAWVVRRRYLGMICPDCGKHYETGDWPYPCAGMGHFPGPFWTGDAQIHQQEKVVVYENPRTGEVRIPGRADRPIPEKYMAEGYQRRELHTPAAIRHLEKTQGVIHERSHYDANSARADRDTNSR